MYVTDPEARDRPRARDPRTISLLIDIGVISCRRCNIQGVVWHRAAKVVTP